MGLLSTRSVNKLPPTSPFYSKTHDLDTVEWIKLLFGSLIILPIRLIASVSIFVFAGIVCSIIVFGTKIVNKDGDQIPLSPRRRRVAVVFGKFVARLFLHSLGYHYIKIKGKMDPQVYSPSFPFEFLVHRFSSFCLSTSIDNKIKFTLFCDKWKTIQIDFCKKY